MAKGGALSDIVGAALVILVIFALIYMIADLMKGIVLVVFCGVLIFARAFLNKRGW